MDLIPILITFVVITCVWMYGFLAVLAWKMDKPIPRLFKNPLTPAPQPQETIDDTLDTSTEALGKALFGAPVDAMTGISAKDWERKRELEEVDL